MVSMRGFLLKYPVDKGFGRMTEPYKRCNWKIIFAGTKYAAHSRWQPHEAQLR